MAKYLPLILIVMGMAVILRAIDMTIMIQGKVDDTDYIKVDKITTVVIDKDKNDDNVSSNITVTRTKLTMVITVLMIMINTHDIDALNHQHHYVTLIVSSKVVIAMVV